MPTDRFITSSFRFNRPARCGKRFDDTRALVRLKVSSIGGRVIRQKTETSVCRAGFSLRDTRNPVPSPHV
jgi:hypothetical protein